MSQLNPKDAPPGLRAEISRNWGLCNGCYYFEQVPLLLDKGCQCPDQYGCLPGVREDGCTVIFVKEPEQEKPCPV